MAIKVIDTIEPVNNQFKVTEAKNVGYTNGKMTDVSDVGGAIDYIYNILNAKPSLKYEDGTENPPGPQYYQLGEEAFLRFYVESAAPGQMTIRIKRNGNDFKVVSVAKGAVSISLGIVTESASYTYTVSAIDSLNNASESSLTFQHILGGVTLTTGLNNYFDTKIVTVKEGEQTSIGFQFTLTYAEIYQPRYLELYVIDNETQENISYEVSMNEQEIIVENNRFLVASTNQTQTILLKMNLPKAGLYTLAAQGIIVMDNNTEQTSGKLEYPFHAIAENTIAITDLSTFSDNIDTNTNVEIKFKITTNISSLQSNKLKADIRIYYIPDPNNPTAKEEKKRTSYTGISSLQNFTYNAGVLKDAGLYVYQITAGSIDEIAGAVNYTNAGGTINIAQGAVLGENYTKDNLLAFFSAKDPQVSSNLWYGIDAEDKTSRYYFELNGLNNQAESGGNGWVSGVESYLKFSGDSYGQLYYSDPLYGNRPYGPMELLAPSVDYPGVTIEAMFRTRNVGVLGAKVLSCLKENSFYGGASIGYNSARISSNQRDGNVSLAEDEWIHIAFVFDKQIKTDVTNSNIELLNPVRSMKIYINGVLTKYVAFPVNETFYNENDKNYLSMLLNASFDPLAQNSIINFGSSEINLIRIYSAPLNSTEVYNNYLNSQFTPEDQEVIDNRNSASTVRTPVIYFVRNQLEKIENYQNSKRWSKYANTFEKLHQVTTKKANDDTTHTSKNSWVNCTMWYEYYDKNEKKCARYNNVFVYLQGTSSLLYPVKNYQIKIFTDPTADDPLAKGEKYKIYPPNKVGNNEETNDSGWMVKDNVFTLKCDYMEQSHKNNTPTACFYETQVLPTVQQYVNKDTEDELSPARQITTIFKKDNGDNTFDEITVSKYRDAINGFPVLVYYYDNPSKDVNDNPLQDANDYTQVFYSGEANYAGTFMFNVDKEGKQLGFEIEFDEQENFAVTGGGFEEKIIGEDGQEIGKVNSFTVDDKLTDIYGNNILDKNGNTIALKNYPCISYEGATNSNVAAAAFWTLDQYNEYSYDVAIKTNWEELKAIVDNGIPSTKPSDMKDEDYQKLKEQYEFATAFIATYPTLDSYITYVYNNQHLDNLDGNFVSKTIYIETKGFKTYEDYIEATLEPRFNYLDDFYDEDDEDSPIDEDTYRKLTYERMKSNIEWLSWAWDNKPDTEDFKKEFEKRFSLTYCLTYYLQMMMFAQVDNAGKNAMFDTWGGKLYPRPYDMDTQMGETNTGIDSIPPSAEVNVSISPTSTTGNLASKVEVSNGATDANHERYSTFNTTQSKLWMAFGRYYATDIQGCYAKLRDAGVYSVDNVCSFVEAMTSDVLGETFYNKDAAAKYLSQIKYTDDSQTIIEDEHSSKLQGNRDSRYRQFFQQRLIFLDTYFKYSGENTAAITGRSDANSTGNTVKIGISVYSPSYITINIGSSSDAIVTFYVDENSSYEYNGYKYEGILLTLPFEAMNKEFSISGAKNIKTINHMENLKLSELQIANAKQLLNLDIPNSLRLKSMEVGANTFLRSINLSGSTQLVTGLNLQECKNLQSVNVSNTKISSLTLPSGGNLKTLRAANIETIQEINLQNLQFLSLVDISNCPKIQTYIVKNCPLITSIDCSGFLALQKIEIANCKGLTDLLLSQTTTLKELSISSCDKLKNVDMSQCQGSVFNALNLTGLPNLETLNISGTSATVDKPAINLMLYAEKDEDGNYIGNSALKHFIANGSTLKTISYAVQTEGYDNLKCDFGQLLNLETVNIKNCKTLEAITDLNFIVKKSGQTFAGLFSDCSNLVSITGALTYDSSIANGQSISSIMQDCNKLQDITELQFGLTQATDASNALYGCRNISLASIQKLLQALKNVTNLNGFVCLGFNSNSSQRVPMPTNLLANNTKVTTLSLAFYGTAFTTANITLAHMPNLTSTTQMFANCSYLTSVNHDIIKNNTQLRSVDAMFVNCANLKYLFIDENGIKNSFDIFPASHYISNIKGMFFNCSKLHIASKDGIKVFFDSLGTGRKASSITQLNAQGVFYNCFKGGDSDDIDASTLTSLPDGVFSKCPHLTNISYAFARTGIVSLPANSLFLEANEIGPYLVTDNVKFQGLTKAQGLFADCVALTGAIPQHLFTGAENLRTLGAAQQSKQYIVNEDGVDNIVTITNDVLYQTTTLYTGGAFSNTGILYYDFRFLARLKKLIDVSLLFFKGTGSTTDASIAFVPSQAHSNSGKLVGVNFNSSATGSLYYQGVYEKIFANNPVLQDAKYAFAGNTGIQKCITTEDEYTSIEADGTEFFKSNPQIKNLEGLFARCVSLNTIAYNNMFKNLSQLTTVKCAFANCIALGSYIDKDIFEGCTLLKNCSGLFFNCYNLTGNNGNIAIPVELFNSCRDTLEDTSYMFTNCYNLNGIIGTGTATVEVANDNFEIISIDQYGLLANCILLKNAEKMFACCQKLDGAIPQDIFYTDGNKFYNNLTNISSMFEACTNLAVGDQYNRAYIYQPSGLSNTEAYFVPINWLSKCPKLKNISRIFNQIANSEASAIAPILVNGGIDTNDITTAESPFQYVYKNTGTVIYLQILPDSLFEIQSELQDISYAFAHNKAIGKTNLTSAFMTNSLNTIKNAAWLFGFSTLRSIGTDASSPSIFEKYLGTNFIKNTSIESLAYAFYATNRSGDIPWADNQGTISATGLTGFGPRLSNFSKANFTSAFHGQSNLSNYRDEYAANASVIAGDNVADYSHYPAYQYNFIVSF